MGQIVCICNKNIFVTVVIVHHRDITPLNISKKLQVAQLLLCRNVMSRHNIYNLGGKNVTNLYPVVDILFELVS